jgi:hypothetical protein
MMRSRVITWVVYEGLERGKPSGTYAVCEQTEWDQMEKLRPGEHPLFKMGIGNEGEAERIARATTLSKRAAS